MSATAVRVVTKATLRKGQPAQIECLDIAGQTFTITRGLVTTVRLEDEWFQEVADPPRVIETLRSDRTLSADIFTFCQRLPHLEPRFEHRREWESIAAVPLTTYEHWWSKQIEGATRNQIRKSQKVGVEVRECSFDDEFVRGMTEIFNETPIRQGRPFWHYGKDTTTVKQQFSRFLHREDLVGAYFNGELIGFAMVGRSATYGDLGQIIAKVAHRDKSPTTALIAKAVEVCAARRLGHLVYAYWTADSLGAFKRRLGFKKYLLPRYLVPLSARGTLALHTGTHRAPKDWIPAPLLARLKQARSAWYEWHESRR
jgi:Acetyltransferase (GNAT) family